MPGVVRVYVEIFNQIDRFARKKQIGWPAIFVVGRAGAVGLIEIEVAAKPVGGIVGVAERVGVFVEERFVPRKAIIAESKQSDQQANSQ